MQIQSNNLFKNLQKKKYFESLPNFKEERTQKFTTLVFTIIALCLFGLFAISPTLSTIGNLNKQLADDKFIEQQLSTKINNLYVLQQKYAEIQPDLPYIIDSVPKNPLAPLLVAQIQSLAQNSNISIKGIQTLEVEIPNAPSKQKSFYAYNFNLTANGSYEDLTKFIDSMIKMQRIVYINVISITKNSGQQGPLSQLNFKGTAYFKQ